MIKKLRTRFIISAMLSVAAVLGVIILILNIYNYVQMNHRIDTILELLAENSGAFPGNAGPRGEPGAHPGEESEDALPEPPDDGSAAADDGDFPPDDGSAAADNGFLPEPPDDGGFRGEDDFPGGRRESFLTAETPFETRFFTVTLDNDGTVSSSNLNNIAAVNSDDASGYALALFASGSSGGFVDGYKYRAVSSDEGTLYIFVDTSKELSAFYSVLWGSILISAGGLLLVFLMVLLLSRRALRPVEESYNKQKRFITDASHELKTPLTIIDANTDILEIENGESQWTQSIKNQVQRLTGLVEKMVLLTRMDEGSASMEMKDFSLSEAVRDTAEPYTAIAASRQKTLEIDIAGGLTLNGNEENIRRMVSLLLDNAMKYSSENGTIRLHLRAAGRSRELTVWNTADDLPQGSLDYLFERFYRLDASRNSKTGGYGIGLSVAQAIVLAHHGKISAKSDDGRSILFTVLL